MIFSRHHIILIALCLPLSVSAQDSADFGGGFAFGGEQKQINQPTEQTETLNILSCPVEIFKKAYQSIQPNAQALALIHLENEAISACAIRQAKVNEILKNEETLRKLLKDLNKATEVSAAGNDEGGDNLLGEEKATIPIAPIDMTVATELTPNSLLSEDTPKIDPVEIKVVPQPVQENIYSYEVEIAGHQYLGDEYFKWATVRRNDGEIIIVKLGDELAGGFKVTRVTDNDVVVEDASGISKKLTHTIKTPPQVIFMDFGSDEKSLPTLAPMNGEGDDVK